MATKQSGSCIRGKKRHFVQQGKATSDGVDIDTLVPDSFPANRQLCWKSELAYFDNYPASQNCILGSEYIIFDPVTAITDAGNVFDFVLPPAQEYVYDPTNIRVGLNLKIVKSGASDGGKIGPYRPDKNKENIPDPPEKCDPVALVNCPLTSMFYRVEVMINDVPVNSNCIDHHYRAFFENSFNYSPTAKNTLLSPIGYHEDFAKPESTLFSENLGLATRARWTQRVMSLFYLLFTSFIFICKTFSFRVTHGTYMEN